MNTRPEVSEVDPPKLKIRRDIRDWETDWETYKIFRMILKQSKNISRMSPKKSERHLIQNWRYPFIDIISVRK